VNFRITLFRKNILNIFVFYFVNFKISVNAINFPNIDMNNT